MKKIPRRATQAQSEQIKDIFRQCATKPISYWSHLGAALTLVLYASHNLLLILQTITCSG